MVVLNRKTETGEPAESICLALDILFEAQERLNNVQVDEIIQQAPGLIQVSEANFIWHQGRYHPVIEEVLTAIHRSGIPQRYYWDPWDRRALSLSLHPEKLGRARMATCLKLLTHHARREHFCEGHFADMIIQGQIEALFARIRQLHDKRSSKWPRQSGAIDPIAEKYPGSSAGAA